MYSFYEKKNPFSHYGMHYAVHECVTSGKSCCPGRKTNAACLVYAPNRQLSCLWAKSCIKQIWWATQAQQKHLWFPTVTTFSHSRGTKRLEAGTKNSSLKLCLKRYTGIFTIIFWKWYPFILHVAHATQWSSSSAITATIFYSLVQP